MRVLVLSVAIRVMSRFAASRMTAMERCERLLNPRDIDDLEHMEEHAVRRQEMGKRLGRLHDLRDRLSSRH